MNNYLRGAVCLCLGIIKISFNKIFHMNNFHAPLISILSINTEISIEGILKIGKGFKMRDGAKIRVRKGAICNIGRNVSINSYNVVTCREKIEIGNNVMFSPNVLIFDHDHNYHVDGGINANKYITSPVKIGNNVWIGANVVILRGVEIGDGSIIGAGCVLTKGIYPSYSVIMQKRETQIKAYSMQ